MNTAKLSNALRKLGEASYELADALLDTPDPVRSGGPEAGEVAPSAPVATFEASPFEAQPSFADESVEFSHPKGGFEAPQPSERDIVLGRCPTHDVPWTIKPGGFSTRTNKTFAAFWKCAERNADDTWCSKKPDKGWVKTHDPEKALAAA